MSDLVDRINAVRREVGGRTLPGGDATTVVLRRSYPYPVEDLWDACTAPERIARWLAPVSGDLRLGGRYQLEGNAGGEVLRCEPPTLISVSWIFGEAPEGTSEVTVRLTAQETDGGGSATLFELEHAAVPDPSFWDEYGPGAVGVGWDLALLGLDHHLDGADLPREEEMHLVPEGRAFILASCERWGEAHVASGVPEADAGRSAGNTAAFYAPPPPRERLNARHPTPTDARRRSRPAPAAS
ncbi:SRPBCC family protein [Streptomyces sp. SBT349]|uniref:SRPBCC family protein n=1 Tax=Streptomyces sp. SBT349 TaxID=1580539 RepID=UPI0007C7C69C|nr:SRPBCC family protein [Streptomyces sp. SBT349]